MFILGLIIGSILTFVALALVSVSKDNREIDETEIVKGGES